ncbi:MAG: ROK family protein, partial [Candidatus Omnitrophica bacterium]|nr:ROK family protein [Candidatus Omnitrophota bacterium]
MAISFPGPVENFSTVDRAPTLWGTNTKRINLAALLKKNMPDLKEVYVLHDISADAIRYAVEKKKEKFCVVTVGSGISCRIYDRGRGGLITDEYDLTGEIGHLKIDYSKDAPLCECGERGHLNAFASGRAVERILREKAERDLEEFRQSLLYKYTNGDFSKINNVLFADAVSDRDEWALGMLKGLAQPVAHAINHVSAISGIRDFYLVGGFAIVHGDVYLDAILDNLREIRLLNRSRNYFDGRIELGYSDDADGMRGAGYFAQYQITSIAKAPETILSRGHVKKFVDEDGGTFVEALAPMELSYKNYFTKGIFEENNSLIVKLCEGRKSLMVIDEAVYTRWKDKIDRYIWTNKLDCTVLSLPGGEAAKDIDYAEAICTRASDLGLNRKGIIIAVGGGAIMDVAGLAAQLYRRGVDYVRVPTTLLGMIDAAVGVKVGINYNGNKNFIGAFYPPKYVITDTGFLGTLPEREMRGGAAEIIKVALISNPNLFEILEKYGEGFVKNMKFKGYDQFIEDSATELLKHLQIDFYEHDLMRHVDFGHTMAHYFESASNYEMTHGEAVAIDMLISAYIARDRGILSSEDFDRILALHNKLGLPFYHPAISLEIMWSGVQKAISHKGGHLMMVVPKKIGQTVFIDSLSKEELSDALELLKRLDSEKTALSSEKLLGSKSFPAGDSAIRIPFEKVRGCLVKSKDKFPDGVIEGVVNILEVESREALSIGDIKKRYPDNAEASKKRIVFTGGVYGGKTTFLRRVAPEYSEDTVYLPEVLPSLIDGGIEINPDSYIEQVNVQRLIFVLKYLLEVETSLLHPNKVVLCERGTLDGLAWWPGEVEDFTREFGGVKGELSRYKYVIFIQSIASVDVSKRELKKRYENVERAKEIDVHLESIWRAHEGFHKILHTSWDEKVSKLREILAQTHKSILTSSSYPASAPIADESNEVPSSPAANMKYTEKNTMVLTMNSEVAAAFRSSARFDATVEGLKATAGIGNVNQTRAAPEGETRSISSPSLRSGRPLSRRLRTRQQDVMNLNSSAVSSSPATITVSAYTNPRAWQEATEALLGPMVAEHGERIFNVTDLLNEHAQAPDMVSLDGTPGLEQIVRANP